MFIVFDAMSSGMTDGSNADLGADFFGFDAVDDFDVTDVCCVVGPTLMIWRQDYSTLFNRHRAFKQISWRVCLWRNFPALSNMQVRAGAYLYTMALCGSPLGQGALTEQEGSIQLTSNS
jgi:hypothetical protein